MIEPLVRLLLLGAVLGAAFVLATLSGRRRGRVAAAPLPPGVTVVVGPHCRLCDPALEAIRAADPGAEPRVIDGPTQLLEDLRIRSLPTALVVDRGGSVVIRRSGPAVLHDAATVARAARNLLETS